MRNYLIGTVVLFGLLLVARPGLALMLADSTEVGSIDDLIAQSSNIGNSDAEELAWINQEAGTNYELANFIKMDFTPYLQPVYDNSVVLDDVYAFALNYNPHYYLLKIGNGLGVDVHYLYRNVEEFGWGVIDFYSIFQGANYDLMVVSHTSGTAPVPEPATILLISTGLVGFAGTRIRKRFKK
jgi:hypothetical protein